jgi:hypothetical protein
VIPTQGEMTGWSQRQRSTHDGGRRTCSLSLSRATDVLNASHSQELNSGPGQWVCPLEQHRIDEAGEVSLLEGQVTIEVRPDSVTMLRASLVLR